MGYYIQGPTFDKAGFLKERYGAKEVGTYTNPPTKLPEGQLALICVIENPYFDAAALVCHEQDLRELSDIQDTRPKTYLTMDKATAHKLADYNGK